MPFYRLLRLVPLAVLVAAAAGAQGQTPPSERPAQTTPAKNAYVRLVHAIPDAPPVAIAIGSRTVLPKVAYRTVSRYLPLPAGTHAITLTVADDGRTVMSFPLELEGGKVYTAAAAGTLRTLRPVLIEDAITPPARGAGHLRLIALGPDAPAVDMFTTKPREKLFFRDAAYTTGTAYKPFPAGAYVFEVRPGYSPYRLGEPASVTISTGKSVTAFVFGLLKEEGAAAFRVVVVPDDPAAKETKAPR